jgi:hypothetical protein
MVSWSGRGVDVEARFLSEIEHPGWEGWWTSSGLAIVKVPRGAVQLASLADPMISL